MPWYAKVDLEESSLACVRSLLAAGRPRYVSVETGLGGELEEAIRVFQQAGYRRFKLVGQALLCPRWPSQQGGCGSGPASNEARDAMRAGWRRGERVLVDARAGQYPAEDWYNLHAG